MASNDSDDLLSDDRDEPIISGGLVPAAMPTIASAEIPHLAAVGGEMAQTLLLPSEIIMAIMMKIRMTIVYVGWFYWSLFFLLVVMSLVLLGPGVMWFTDRSTSALIDFARLAISLIALASGAGCLAIAFMHGKLKDQLVQAETTIDVLRDQAFLQIQNAHYNLEQLTEKLKFPTDKSAPSPLDYIEVAKKIGPLVSLLLSKERSVMTLGMEGLKFYQSLKKILNR